MRTALAAGAALLGLPLAQAQASEPLYVKNLAPVSNLFGLPAQRSADWRGGWQAALHSSIANNYVSEFSGDEQVNFDGETLRLALELRYGFADDWDLQLEIPWMQHDGGHLDSLIDSWHDFWGMSDGGRKDVDRDLLDFSYRGPRDQFQLLDDASGVGDISLSLNRAFYRRGDTVAGLGLGYKFASGDEDELLGSGSGDAFVTLRFSGGHLSNLPLTWHGQVGYLWAGDARLVENSQESGLWFAGLALDWAAWDTVSLQAQLDLHAAPMDSDVTATGDDAVMVSFGLRWDFHPHWSADFNIVEDAAVETAPDVIFQGSLRYRP